MPGPANARPSRFRRTAASLLASAFITFAPAAPAAPPAGGGSGLLYCCNDSNGKQVCGDILPQACYGRAYREIGDGARTVRQVEAPLTPEQRVQRAADDEKRRQEEIVRKEQQRKDQALLNTYGSERDIDAMRMRAETDVFQSIRNAETKISEIRQLRKKFENEAEFYKKKTLPAEVKKGLDDADFEIRGQESIIESKKKELETIRAKYNDDKRRYIDLSRRQQSR